MLLPASESLAELARLADTAGLVVAGQIVQALRRVHPATFVGAGKVEQIRALADEQQADVAIFDDPLSPAQQRNLEKGCKRKVIDRDRKSTRLNSSHRTISYAVFCLKKKK